jgi:hypothetical protein
MAHETHSCLVVSRNKKFMNIRIVKQKSNHGSALVMTLCVCGVLGILMGSYLYMVQGQRQAVARSQSWNQAMVVAEAGIDEAMALINSGVIGGNFAIFPWKNAGGGNFTNRPTPPQFQDGTNNSSYYCVTINTSATNPVITSTSYVPAPISKTLLSRTVRVNAKPRPTFPVKAPMVVKQSFDSNGSNVGTDSFDSTLGPYNPATAGNNGDVVSLTTTPGSIKVGNGKIKGTVRTPPGGTSGTTSDKTAIIGSSGYVGDATWLPPVGSTPGFQSGHFKDDFTMADFPDVTVPPATWFGPQQNITAPDGNKYDYFLGNLGTYSMAALSGGLYVSAPNTVLYVTDSISISGNKAQNQVHIGPGASLTIYMAGATTSIGGNGLVNETQQAKNFQYYGLPSNTSISITGNGAFFGTIYAPQADFSLKGSGHSSFDDFTGSSITKTTTMTGNFNFHYDDSLSMLTTLGGYDATSWEEL